MCLNLVGARKNAIPSDIRDLQMEPGSAENPEMSRNLLSETPEMSAKLHSLLFKLQKQKIKTKNKTYYNDPGVHRI